ncbi:MAG: hypothetical protein IPP74_14080 [Alphaproteobacteria bacterium]|nr:hypothetical protein [Alphaproteobacteria bacterium]
MSDTSGCAHIAETFSFPAIRYFCCHYFLPLGGLTKRNISCASVASLSGLSFNKTDISAAQAIELSKTIFHASFKLPGSGKDITIFNQLSADQEKLIDL